jgi:hypothetical protein
MDATFDEVTVVLFMTFVAYDSSERTVNRRRIAPAKGGVD